MNKATNYPKIRKTIGPLKRHDDSLAVDDTEKANMMNMFFSTVGQNVAIHLPTLPQHVSHQDISLLAVATVPIVSDIYLIIDEIKKKVLALKTKKSTGPDGISPKLPKLAGNAIVLPLKVLYTLSMNTGAVYHDWKKACLHPVYEKHDAAERGNYRPLSEL